MLQKSPYWVVYFAVDDCDASAEKATSLGAKVLSPPTDIPEIGRFAVIQDAQGAAFAIIKLEMNLLQSQRQEKPA